MRFCDFTKKRWGQMGSVLQEEEVGSIGGRNGGRADKRHSNGSMRERKISTMANDWDVGDL